jgi:hypothetical protein
MVGMKIVGFLFFMFGRDLGEGGFSNHAVREEIAD